MGPNRTTTQQQVFWSKVLAAVSIGALVLASASCVRDRGRLSASDGSPVVRQPVPSPALVSLPPLTAGKPKLESAAVIEEARQEADRLISAMQQAGMDPRDLASMADIRGFRLLRQRRFQRALVWFEAAVRTDRSYEPGFLSAARAATLAGDLSAAARYVVCLQQLNTPFAKRALATVSVHSDFAALRKVARAAPQGADKQK